MWKLWQLSLSFHIIRSLLKLEHFHNTFEFNETFVWSTIKVSIYQHESHIEYQILEMVLGDHSTRYENILVDENYWKSLTDLKTITVSSALEVSLGLPNFHLPKWVIKELKFYWWYKFFSPQQNYEPLTSFHWKESMSNVYIFQCSIYCSNNVKDVNAFLFVR